MEQTWKMPDPPGDDVMVVHDDTGRQFYRADQTGEYWYSEAPGAGRGTYSWADLLVQRGPVRAA